MKLRNFFRRGGTPSNHASDITEIENLTIDSERLRRLLQSNQASGINVNELGVLGIPTALRAVILLSNTIAGLPFELIRTTGVDTEEKEIITEHPILRAFTRKANPRMDAYTFRRLLQTHLCFRGNAYARIIRPLRRSAPVEFLPLHPDVVTPKEIDGGLRLEYEIKQKNGRPITLSQDEVLHLRGLSLDGIVGVAPIAVARMAFALGIQGQVAASKMFQQGTLSGFGLSHPGKLSQEAIENIQEAWVAQYGGTQNTGVPPVFQEGMEPKELGFSAQDAQFLESRRFTVADIARLFGMPPHMVGDTERSTSWGTGIAEQTIGFQVYTLDEWFNVWENAIHFALLDSDPDLLPRIQARGLERGDSKTRWSNHEKAIKNQVLTPNEVRAIEGIPPREGGDEVVNLTGQPSGEDDEPVEDDD